MLHFVVEGLIYVAGFAAFLVLLFGIIVVIELSGIRKDIRQQGFSSRAMIEEQGRLTRELIEEQGRLTRELMEKLKKSDNESNKESESEDS